MEQTQKPTNQNDKIETENATLTWLDAEAKEVEANKYDGEQLPPLALEDGKITMFEVDFSKPFEKYTSPEGAVKKIIPVLHEGTKKVLWLNVKNPLYSDIILSGKSGKVQFKVMRTGQKQNTRYALVKD